MLQRLRDRTLEENFRLESDQELSQGILLGGVLGVIQYQEVILRLSPLLGGGKISREGSMINATPAFARTTHPKESRQKAFGGAPPRQSWGPNMATYFSMMRAAATQDQRRPGALSRTRTETPPWRGTANM